MRMTIAPELAAAQRNGKPRPPAQSARWLPISAGSTCVARTAVLDAPPPDEGRLKVAPYTIPYS
jgi:hypothetical protein